MFRKTLWKQKGVCFRCIVIDGFNSIRLLRLVFFVAKMNCLAIILQCKEKGTSHINVSIGMGCPSVRCLCLPTMVVQMN